MADGFYTVEAREFVFPTGLGGHYFLVMKDPQGNVVMQWHGLGEK